MTRAHLAPGAPPQPNAAVLAVMLLVLLLMIGLTVVVVVVGGRAQRRAVRQVAARNPGLAVAPGTFGESLWGTFWGVPVQMEVVRLSPSGYGCRFMAQPPGPIPAGLELRKRSKELLFGDPEGGPVFVSADDPQQAAAYLANPAFHAEVARLLREHPGMLLSGGVVCVTTRQVLTEVDEIETCLRNVASFAHLATRSRG